MKCNPFAKARDAVLELLLRSAETKDSNVDPPEQVDGSSARAGLCLAAGPSMNA
jgi:hypothetical protein